jgi:uncharacterized coiled-coil protein SlyX
MDEDLVHCLHRVRFVFAFALFFIVVVLIDFVSWVLALSVK